TRRRGILRDGEISLLFIESLHPRVDSAWHRTPCSCAVHIGHGMSMRLTRLGASFQAVVICLCGVQLGGCSYFESSDIRRVVHHLAAGKWEQATIAYRQALKEAP